MDETTIKKYDRLRGGLKDLPGVIFTKPSTVRNIEQMTGKVEMFIVETCRYDEKGGDYIFIECVDENGVTRIALPPKVANLIAYQHDSLTTKRRSAAGKRRAADLTEADKDVLRERLNLARKARKKRKKA